MRQTALHEEVAGPITEFRDCEIFCNPVTSLRTPLRSPPIVLLALSHMFHGSLEPPQTPSIAEERSLEEPAGLPIYKGLESGLYSHPCQDGRASDNGPPHELLPTPPRICVGVLRGCHASTQAHHYAQVQHIVVDLEEPRSLRPTIGWPASGAMRHPAYQLLRIPLPRTWMNKGEKEGRGATL